MPSIVVQSLTIHLEWVSESRSSCSSVPIPSLFFGVIIVSLAKQKHQSVRLALNGHIDILVLRGTRKHMFEIKNQNEPPISRASRPYLLPE